MAFDITLDPVEVALVAAGTEVQTTDFVAATWVRGAPILAAKPLFHLTTAFRYVKVTGTIVASGVKESDFAYARILLGPNGVIAPPVGTSDVYVHVGDNPEDIYMQAGQIKTT